MHSLTTISRLRPLAIGAALRRCVAVVDAMADKPNASIPSGFADEAALEAYYKLMRNEAIEHADLLESHFGAAAVRCVAKDKFLVGHHTTTCGSTSMTSRRART